MLLAKEMGAKSLLAKCDSLLVTGQVTGEYDMNQKYMKMTKDTILEGSSQQANKDLINKRNGQSPKHLKIFLLVFSKDEV